MPSAINIKSTDWWLSFFIVLTMTATIAGFTEASYVVIVLSIIRFLLSTFSQGITSEAAVYRLTYIILISGAFYCLDSSPLAWWLLLIATTIYIFFDKYLV